MVAYDPNTLLLRIRTETLGLNLQKAHCSLQMLPNLSGDLEEIRILLKRARALIEDQVLTVITESKKRIRKSEPLDRISLDGAERAADDNLEILHHAITKLATLENKSFLVQVRSIGKEIWRCLEDRAFILQDKVKELERRIVANGAGTVRPGREEWEGLRKATSDATTDVFNESIELLGGIALRDARLDADICDLADALIRSIAAVSPDRQARVIPGSIASIMMTLERFVRLPFPEWTVWALPSVAHDFWRLADKREIVNSLSVNVRRRQESEAPAKLLDNPYFTICLADMLATYAMGPAYAYAIVTLLLDPTDPSNDLRVYSILKMLDVMNGQNVQGMTESYVTLAHELEEAWKAAKSQTQASPSQFPPIEASSLNILTSCLQDVLQRFSIREFSWHQWMPLNDWRKPLLDGEVEKISSLPDVDMRHVLNAAWLARVERRPIEDKLTENVMKLAQLVVKNQQFPTVSPGMRSELRRGA